MQQGGHNRGLKIAAIIQARMSSERLPGKVLCEIEGKPVLGYLLERIKFCRQIYKIIVATSAEKEDSAIADFCGKSGVDCYRGSLSDVADRFKEISEMYNLDGFVRISADSPLLDQEIVEKAVEIFRGGQFDIVTNVQRRTYPKGESVEVVKSKTFLKGFAQMRKPEYLEHVTKYFYDNPESFRICNLNFESNCSAINLSLDTTTDLQMITSIIKQMRRPHWQYGLKQVLESYQQLLCPK